MHGIGWSGWQNPWQLLQEVEREMGRLWGDYSGPRGASFPPINIDINTDGATVTAELPGVEPDELDVSVHGRTLVLRGERKRPDVAGEARWLRQERVFGEFARNIDLAFAIDPDSVEATCRDGVLKVRLRRAEADKPKQIAVGN